MGVLAYERGVKATTPTFLSDEEWQLLGGNGTWVRANECYAPGPVVDGAEARRRQKMERYVDRPQDPRHSVRESCIANAEIQRRQAEKLNEEANERDREAVQLREHAAAALEEAQIFKELADAVHVGVLASTPSNPMPAWEQQIANDLKDGTGQDPTPPSGSTCFAEELLDPVDTVCAPIDETVEGLADEGQSC